MTGVNGVDAIEIVSRGHSLIPISGEVPNRHTLISLLGSILIVNWMVFRKPRVQWMSDHADVQSLKKDMYYK